MMADYRLALLSPLVRNYSMCVHVYIARCLSVVLLVVAGVTAIAISLVQGHPQHTQRIYCFTIYSETTWINNYSPLTYRR